MDEDSEGPGVMFGVVVYDDSTIVVTGPSNLSVHALVTVLRIVADTMEAGEVPLFSPPTLS